LSSQAQITPQPSSSQTITQGFGLGTITLNYSRPNTKGRKIFGYVEPYDKVWRTGANSATVIKFSDDVMLEGNKVPAGEYGLFSIPGENQWTIILSKKPKQWGAYTYNQGDDYLRFTVKPVKLPRPVETFTLAFENMYPTSGELHLLRVLLKKGDKSTAITTAQEGVKAATEMKSDEYIRLNTEVITEAGK